MHKSVKDWNIGSQSSTTVFTNPFCSVNDTEDQFLFKVLQHCIIWNWGLCFFNYQFLFIHLFFSWDWWQLHTLIIVMIEPLLRMFPFWKRLHLTSLQREEQLFEMFWEISKKCFLSTTLIFLYLSLPKALLLVNIFQWF
jgi:hypothetical protein